MTSQLRFDGKVAIITGAGQGLGRSYALYLAARGAKVVVNDIGCSVTGVGQDTKLADAVVAEIKKNGGVAVASYDSAEFGEKVVKTAVDNFGTVDIVINNAGILRDVSFMKMSDEDWDLIYRYHTKATYSVTRAAWNIMREKSYGRIINTSSSAGMFGAFGQANYSNAKMGFFGFTQTLAKEGEKRNIFVNCIAPLAGSRMTKSMMPEEIYNLLNADYVAPLVALLAHEKCPETGILYEVAGGYIAKARWQRSNGHLFNPKQLTPEGILEKYETIADFDKNPSYPTGNQDMFEIITANLGSGQTSGNGLKADEIFGMMYTYLSQGHGKDLPAKIQAIYGFEITKTKGGKVEVIYEIDLKNGQGNVKKGKPERADATFTMTDADFDAVCLGKLNPQIAFMQGKMKIKGNMAKASKFTPELFPAPTPENIAKYSSAKL